MFKNFNATSQESVDTPIGQIIFTMSQRFVAGIPEHSAIANHPETGVMALSIAKIMDGDSSARRASADAAYDLCMTVHAVKTLNREACL